MNDMIFMYFSYAMNAVEPSMLCEPINWRYGQNVEHIFSNFKCFNNNKSAYFVCNVMIVTAQNVQIM